MLTEASVWLSAVKSLMEDISWTMPEIKLTNFTKIFTFQFQEEPSPIDYHCTLMHILSTTQSDHLVQPKSLHHIPKTKALDFTCSSHQDCTMDIHAVPQEKDVKQQRLNLKRLTSQNWPVKKHFSMLPKCTHFFI